MNVDHFHSDCGLEGKRKNLVDEDEELGSDEGPYFLGTVVELICYQEEEVQLACYLRSCGRYLLDLFLF